MTRTSETGTPASPETMPREDLEQLQVSRVRSCVERLQASEIRYYKERLADVDPGQINSPDDLSRLPFTVKEDLREHYPFGMFLAPLSEIVRIHASTGSTGKADGCRLHPFRPEALGRGPGARPRSRRGNQG
jgi:phenylacetate-coenzyme A ligase PaaK-like adenylate-forming protein